MQNPFQHINDVLNYSGREAYRMLGNQVNTEHLMLGILHCITRGISAMPWFVQITKMP